MNIRKKQKDLIYLGIAEDISKLSKDKETHVGAVIVDKDGKVVSMGYNGSAQGMDDNEIPHSRVEERCTITIPNELKDLFPQRNKYKEIHFESNKYPYMLHAEENAILTSSDNHRLKGATIYVTHYPCNKCANMIAQSGITNIKCYNNRVGSLELFIKESLFIIQKKKINLEIFEV